MRRIKTCGVYAIRNAKTGKVYVGSSVGIEARKQNHFTALRKSRHYRQELQDDWNLLGEGSFSFEILEVCEPEDRIGLEKSWIDYFKSMDSRYGYNVRDPRTVNVPESSRKKISASLKGVNTWTSGVPRPQWVKDKISDGGKGLSRSQDSIERYRRSKMGERNPMSKLTDQERTELLRDRSRGSTYSVLASKYGLTVQGIASLIQRHNRRNESQIQPE